MSEQIAKLLLARREWVKRVARCYEAQPPEGKKRMRTMAGEELRNFVLINTQGEGKQ